MGRGGGGRALERALQKLGEGAQGSMTFLSMYRRMYHKSTSIGHFEHCNQQLSNLICQNCNGSIKILLDVGSQQHAM